MKLQDLLSRHPEVSLAKASDNEAILKFFDSFPIKGKSLKLQYVREPDFFSFLNCHSKEFFVFLLWDQGAIQGVGTLVIRNGSIQGEQTSVGYLGDLRVKSGFKNGLRWRKFYDDLIKNSSEIVELKGTKHFLTAVIDSNQEAQSALIKNKKTAFSYHLLARYHMANIYFKKPFRKSSSEISVRTASQEDIEGIKDFWKRNSKSKNFGWEEEISHALSEWHNFDLSHFLIALKDKKIVGMTGLWSPTPKKKIILRDLNLSLKIFSQVIRLKKPTFPRDNEELKPLYMTHLGFDSTDVLRELTLKACDHSLAKSHHTLSMALFTDEERSILKDFICDEIPMALYQVYDGEKNDLILSKAEAPFFEMALV